MQKLIDYLDPIHSGILAIAEQLKQEEEKLIKEAYLHGSWGRSTSEAAETYFNTQFKNKQ